MSTRFPFNFSERGIHGETQTGIAAKWILIGEDDDETEKKKSEIHVGVIFEIQLTEIQLESDFSRALYI